MEKKTLKKPTAAARSLRSLFWVVCLCLLFILGASPGATGAASSTAKKSYSKEFETAISVIKKYEGLHKNHATCVGYGHTVVSGDGYKRRQNLTEVQADALLRKDLAELCAKYRDFGRDSLILAALAYNIGTGNVAKSTVYKRLKAGNREIKELYLTYCRYRGKVMSQIKRRRAEEYELLFIK